MNKKIPKIVKVSILKDKIIWSEDYTTDKSFRQLMNSEINQNTWGSLGINVALGSILDRKATSTEYLYLPDYVFISIDKAKILINGKEENLVKKTETILDYPEKTSKSDFISPLFVFSLILFLTIYITYKDLKNNCRSKWLDFSINPWISLKEFA